MVVFAYLFFTLPVMIQVVMSLLASAGCLFILYVKHDFVCVVDSKLLVLHHTSVTPVRYFKWFVSGWKYYVEYYIYALWSQRWVSCKRWSCCEYSNPRQIRLQMKMRSCSWVFLCVCRKSGERRETSSRRKWAGVSESLKKCCDQLQTSHLWDLSGVSSKFFKFPIWNFSKLSRHNLL